MFKLVVSVRLNKYTTISFQCTKITQKKIQHLCFVLFYNGIETWEITKKNKKSFWTTYEPQYCTRVFSHFKRKEVQISQETESQLKPQKLHCARNNNETFLISDSLWNYWMLNVFWIFNPKYETFIQLAIIIINRVWIEIFKYLNHL